LSKINRFVDSIEKLAPKIIICVTHWTVNNGFEIYTFLLRHNGTVEEVIIDDYVPVDEKAEPIFAKPH
jgi:hypothetical protein